MPDYDYIKDGTAIYEKSFAIIRSEADLSRFSEAEADVAVRMVHACGLVDAARHFVFSPDFVTAARTALAAGAPIFCDAQMVAKGVTHARLPANNEVICEISNPETVGIAREIGNTRSAAAIRLWLEWMAGSVVGHRQCADGAVLPARTVARRCAEACRHSRHAGRFLSARRESKDALAENSYGVPYAIVRGRLGGSAMTAAALNSLARPGL